MNTYHFGYSVHYSVAVEAECQEEAKERLISSAPIWDQSQTEVKVIFVERESDGGGSPNDD